MAGISHVSILLYWPCKPITHAQSHPNRSLQRASVPPSTCHASITGTTRLFGWQRWLQLCAGLRFRQFLWCLLLEIGGTLYSSHVKGYKLSCSQLLYLAPHFFTFFREEGPEKQLYDSRSLLSIYILWFRLPEQYASDNISSSNGKLLHKSMVENNEEVAQGLAVGTQTLDQLQRCKSYFSGLKETRLRKFTPKMVFCKICLARAD